MPVEKLIPLCKEHGVLCLIDGAHVPGQIPLNLRKLDADFYTGTVVLLQHFTDIQAGSLYTYNIVLRRQFPTNVCKAGYPE